MLKILQAGLQWYVTVNFQMFMLDLEKAEEPEIKCQHLLDHGKSKRVPEKHLHCFIEYTKAFYCVDHNKLWKILQEVGIPDHLTCLLRDLYAGQEGTVRTGHGTTNWFQIQKGVRQGYILSLCLFNLHSKMPGWIKQKLESRLLGEISITSDMQMTPPLRQKAEN